MGVVTICGERFSDNLGDGVIADCLACLLRAERPGDEVRAIDLSMKERYAPAALAEAGYRPRRGGLVAEIRARIPNVVKDPVRLRSWRRRRPALEAFLAPHLAGTDVLIIGGGQLLMDNGLNFPLKLETLMACARRQGIERVVFFGCGVGAEWSASGRAIMAPVLSAPPVRAIVTRDEESQAHLRRHFPELAPPVTVGADPALWAADAYADALRAPERSEHGERRVGLAIMHPRLMRYHVRRVRDVAPARLIGFWADLAVALRAAGHPCGIFTNGSVEDQAFARDVHAAIASRPDLADTPLWPRPVEPADLVRRIAGCRAIVGHRLHASVIAYALGVPAVGLVWDTKTRQFGRQTGRARFFVEAHDVAPTPVCDLVASAMAEGIDLGEQARVKAAVPAALRDAIGAPVAPGAA